MSDLRYGKRNVAKMIRQVEALRQLIRAEGTPDIQTAWDAVEEHIDFAYRALPAVQPDAREVALREAVNGLRKAAEDLDGYVGRGYGDEYLELADSLALSTVHPAHVNETPKNEHETRDMLTPAKGVTHD